MDNISEGMKSLCEDIITGHTDRKRDIKELKSQAEVIRDNAQKFLADSKKLHAQMSKDLRKGLQEKRKEITRDVNVLREDFRKKEEEIRKDLADASKIWNKMNETLKAKKRGD